jgi:GTP-binding protein
MLPVVALLGRPNVGKSTLFNRLTATRDALVADLPGLTRDRQYGFGKLGPVPYIVIDTGGLSTAREGVEALMMDQARKALEEADATVFVVDGRVGLAGADRDVASWLRKSGKPIYLVVNKTEGMDPLQMTAEFHALGLGAPRAISAAHGEGVNALMDEVLGGFPASSPLAPEDEGRTKVAVIGRPNVGKSTLINRMLGEERLIAYDQPGTTRDSIAVPFERDGVNYTLIDTAGVRRKSRVDEAIEKFSIVKTLQAIDEADVVVAVLDAREGVAEQDASLLGLALERGRALVIAINKWDGLTQGQRDETRRLFDVKLPFLSFARVHFISALHGTAVGDLYKSIDEAQRAATRDIPTPELTRVMERAIEQHQPPLVRGRRPKLRYAHQGGKRPPLIIVHGNQLEHLPDAYRRYLENTFRAAFELWGTPIRIEWKGGRNPFAGRRNELTQRQVKKRQRLRERSKRR